MRTLKYILASLLVPFCLTSCDTAQDWIDTGVSSPYHDCSIMEYLRFEGTDPDYEKITFFAIPSYTILRYLWDNDLKADIAYRNPDYLITDQKQDGGTALTTVGGRKLKAYVDKSSYGGVPDVGAETMYLY